MYPPPGSVDAQGHDLQVGTNCLGPYLLYQLLLPLLKRTAASSATGSVRVAWAASIAVHVAAPKPHGMNIEDTGCPKDEGVVDNYAQTKVGNVFIARHCAKETPENKIVHVAFNPGNLRTDLQRHWSGLSAWMTVSYPNCDLRCGHPSWQLRLHTHHAAYFRIHSLLARRYLEDTQSCGQFLTPN